MASAFTHALAAVTFGKIYSGKAQAAKFWALGIVCSILPDADVLAFKFGIPYEHMFGHRGITHSVFFALLLALLVVFIFYRNQVYTRSIKFKLWLYFFACTVSHGILDAMTTGGRGIAFWAPFSEERIFLPWRMIKVSPIQVADFFGEWGIRVIKSEFYWVGIPCLTIMFVLWIVRRLLRPADKSTQ